MKRLLIFFLAFAFVCLALSCSPGGAPSSSSAPVRTLAATDTGSQSSLTSTVDPSVTQVSQTPAAPRVAEPTTSSSPSGSITVAGVGQVSRQITALPQFVADALYDSLLTIDPKDGSLKAGLAESWTVSQDALTITFALRQGVKWHDGSVFTSDDVKFTIEQLSNPKTRLFPAADFGTIQEVAAPDARTVRVTFKEPYCAALTYIGALKILPRHVLEGKQLYNIEGKDLVGTGPLVLKSWGTSSTFSANPVYWNGVPRIATWSFKLYPTDAAALDAVENGQADVVTGAGFGLQGAGSNLRSVSVPGNQFYALAINETRKPLDDARVREAILSAIDRATLVRVLGDEVQPLETSLLPDFWGFPRDITQAGFDPARARQLLADGGWRDLNGDGVVEKDGKPFELTLWAIGDQPLSETSAQMIRAALADIGIRAVLKLNDSVPFWTRVFLQEYDLALVTYNIPLDPDQHYFWGAEEREPGSGLNVSAYSNPSVDQALEQGNRVAQCDPLTRARLYEPMFRTINSEHAMVFLFAPMESIVMRGQVTAIAPSSFAGEFWNLPEWKLAQ